jgi:hypothetical protein
LQRLLLLLLLCQAALLLQLADHAVRCRHGCCCSWVKHPTRLWQRCCHRAKRQRLLLLFRLLLLLHGIHRPW